MDTTLNYFEQDLVVRLVAMGAVPPQELSTMTPEKLEDIVMGLPTVHSYRFELEDGERTCHDISVKGLLRQAYKELGKNDIREFTDYRSSQEYSPEAWMVYLRNNFSTVEKSEVCEVFSKWGIQLDPERVREGFSLDFEKNLEYNNTQLREQQIDLLSRLAASGFIEPLDLDNASTQEADRLISGLPSLTEATLIFQHEDGAFSRERFVNVDEFYIKDVYMGLADEYNSSLQHEEAEIDNFEQEFGIDEILESTGYDKTKKVIGAGTSTLDKQVRQFFADHPELEDKLVHKTIETTGGMAWLDYFKQDVGHACPGGTFSPLKRAFANWNIETIRIKPEFAFRNDSELNLAENRLKFQSKLIQKVVHAGVVSPMPLADWKKLNHDIAEKFIAKIPLLPDQQTPGEWLKLFQNNPPDALGLSKLKNQFEAAGIIYDEGLVKASFKKSPINQKPNKGVQKMELTLDDYKKMLGRLGGKGMPRLSQEAWQSLTLESARETVRMYDDGPSDKQLNLIQEMFEEKRLDRGAVELDAISKMEATAIIDKAPQLQISTEKPEHPMTDETKKELRRLIQQEKSPFINPAKWNNMSEEEGRQKIDNARARMPATEKQVQLIKSEIEGGNITVKDLAKFINAKNIGDKEVEDLNMFQAGKILENRPASAPQKEQLQKLVDSKRLEPFDMANLTMGEASRKLDEVFKAERAPRDPNGPATERQKEALVELSANKEIPEVSQAELESMTVEQASKRIEAAPATKDQKRMVAQFVREEKLDYVPSDAYANLTRGEASQLIQVGKGEIPRDQQPDFSSREYPVSESQMKVLEELQEKGKIPEIPQHITSKQADAIIQDAAGSDPIGPNQIKILDNKIAQGLLPEMSDEEKKNLNRGGFLKLVDRAKENEKIQAKEKTPEAPEASKAKPKGKSKEPAMQR